MMRPDELRSGAFFVLTFDFRKNELYLLRNEPHQPDCLMDAETTQAMLTSTKATLLLVVAAVDALTVGGAQSYTLDTGQTRQTVTKFDVVRLNNMIDSLMNRCATLQARLDGSGTMIGRPAS